jgi:hypothetical protein
LEHFMLEFQDLCIVKLTEFSDFLFPRRLVGHCH